jgi:hypothetical protein
MNHTNITPGQYDSLDLAEASKLFKAAMRVAPMSRIEIIKVANGSDIYRVTVVESSWV